MEKINQHPHHHQQPLQCPRCDSSSTKFCYYNNYNLSQPRHFCKACKRYWTRGGTLRSVPVGGGSRKNSNNNRRAKRGARPSTAANNPRPQPQIDPSPTSNHNIYNDDNPLFGYGLPTNIIPMELNFRFSRFISSTRVSSDGSGFASEQTRDVISATSSKNYPMIFSGCSTSFGAPTSTMASLIASGLDQQQKFVASGGLKDIQEATNNFPGYEGENGEWNRNRVEQIDPSSDLLWNITGVGDWFDPSNMGSSVPSLI